MHRTDLDAIMRVRSLSEKYNSIRINLPRDDGAEGLWAVPVDDDAYDKILDDNSDGEVVSVVLKNQPNGGWHGKHWGDMINVRTRGTQCPVGIKPV
jgi:hypothetical protein